MHRFITAPEQCHQDWVELTGPEVHHMRNVLRLKRGAKVEVLDGLGKCYTVEITELNSRQAKGSTLAVKEQTLPPVLISMGLGILKHKAMETAIRKSVELGVHRIIPLQCRYSVPRKKQGEERDRLDKWNRISAEAVKQCGRLTVPEVAPVEGLESFCQNVESEPLKIFFWENEHNTRLNDIKPEGEVTAITFLVGPEGGFSDEEAEQAKRNGFIPVGLGPRILRAETVPMVALTLLQYRWGDLASAHHSL